MSSFEVSPTGPQSIQARVDELPRAHATLARVLSEGGLSGEQLNEVFSRSVTAECVQCGIRVTGDEIGRIALATGEVADPRLERLRQGYCARRDCSSYFYRMHFGEHPGVNWSLVTKQFAGAPAAESAPAADLQMPSETVAQRRLILRIAAGVAIALVLLWVRHLIFGGSIPLLRQAPKYTVDPSSLGSKGP